MVGEAYIEVDHGPGGTAARFAAPAARVTARAPEAVPAALAALDAALAGGAWVAGYASYELGYALEARLGPLMPPGRRLPLVDFGVFPAGPGPALPAAPGGALGPFRPRWSRADHAAAFARIADYIRAGDIYQANLTLPMDGRWQGDPAAIGAALAARQPVGFGALVALGETVLVSRSPELFFALDGAGGIEARPMKGTAPRDPDPARDAGLRGGARRRPEEPRREPDDRRPAAQRHRPHRRHRLGRVPALFAVETYATVHQMVSRVAGRLRPGVALAGSSRRSFPAAR